jgi:hypothetical protein
MLDSRHKLNMNKDVYMKAIFPIGFFFSLSLIFGNKAYLYLSVAFIQMLKVCCIWSSRSGGWEANTTRRRTPS